MLFRSANRVNGISTVSALLKVSIGAAQDAGAVMTAESQLKKLENLYPNQELAAVVDAVHRVQAVIEFELDGTIVTANSNFLNAVGYELSEIVGKHHRIFCDPAYAKSKDYTAFWKTLGQGEFVAAEFKRFTKSGDEIWINASYRSYAGRIGYAVVPSNPTENATWRTRRQITAPRLLSLSALSSASATGLLPRSRQERRSLRCGQFLPGTARH